MTVSPEYQEHGFCPALQFTTNEMAALFNVLEEWTRFLQITEKLKKLE
jgi:hypothetical protein